MELLSYSAALERAKIGKFNIALIIIAGLTLTSVMFEITSIGFILPLAQCDLDLSTSDKGLLGAISFIGMIISSYVWGILTDAIGRRAVMLPTMFGSFCVTLMSSLSDRFWILLLLRFINGLLISASAGAIYAYVDEFHSDRIRSMAKLWFYMVFSIGTMTIPAMNWLILRESWSIPLGFIIFKPWRLSILCGGLPGLLAANGLLHCPESPKFLLSVGEEKKAIDIIKTIQRWNNHRQEPMQICGIILDKDTVVRQPEDTLTKNTNVFTVIAHRLWTQTTLLFQKRFRTTFVLLCIIQFWNYVVMHGMYIWLPDLADNVVEFVRHHPNNETYICQVTAFKESTLEDTCERLNDYSFLYPFAVDAIFCLEFVIIAIVGDRVRKNYIVFVMCIIFGICGILTVFLNNPLAALSMFVILFGCGGLINVLGGITSELYPTHLRGSALCLLLVFGRLGGVLGTYVVGLLLDNFCDMTLYISGGGLIIAGFLALFVPKEFQEIEA